MLKQLLAFELHVGRVRRAVAPANADDAAPRTASDLQGIGEIEPIDHDLVAPPHRDGLARSSRSMTCAPSATRSWRPSGRPHHSVLQRRCFST